MLDTARLLAILGLAASALGTWLVALAAGTAEVGLAGHFLQGWSFVLGAILFAALAIPAARITVAATAALSKCTLLLSGLASAGSDGWLLAAEATLLLLVAASGATFVWLQWNEARWEGLSHLRMEL